MQPNFATLKPVINQPNFNALKVGSSPSLSPSEQIYAGLAKDPTVTPTSPFGQKTFDQLLQSPVSQAIQTIFPGKQVGEAIETAAGALYTKAKDLVTGSNDFKNYDLSAPSPLQVGGDIAQGALTVAAPGVGTGETIAGRIGANAALGAGIGGTGAIAQGKDLSGVVKDTTIGGILGGGVSALGEGISQLTQKLPTWFTKSALPKLKEGNIPYALDNTTVGSTKTLLNNSKDAIGNYSDQISTILNHPQYANETGDTTNLFDQLVSSFPKADYSKEQLVTKVKDLVPGHSKLVQAVADGTANLAQQNELRSAIDVATKSVYTSINRPPEVKAIGSGLADILRSNVQNAAPETKPIFQNFSKEIDLNNVLTALDKKNNLKPSWQDFASAYGGYETGGVKGAISALVAERLLGSTGGKLAVAKVVSNATPILNAIGKGTKATLVKNMTQ